MLVVADYLLGLTPWLLLAGACAYVSWHVYHVHLLAQWLASGGRELEPATRGIWAQVFESLSRIHRQNRKRKKRLRKVVMRFQQAAEAMPDGAIVLDANGIVLWMNEASSRLLGLEGPRDVGQPVSDFIRHPKFADTLNAEAFDEPLHITSPLREELHLLIRIVPYGGSRRLMVVRDVTRIYNLEQMRKDFVANVSHELRSPLTVIVGYLEALEDDELLPDEFVRPIEQMSQQASRMSLIVEDLLQLSRLEATPGAASAGPVEVPEMPASIAKDARALSEGAHRIVHDADPERRLERDLQRVLERRVQRGAAHPHGRGHPAAVGTGRGGRRPADRDRYRGGHRREPHPAPHRAVLSRRQGALARDGRHRARTGDREARPGAARCAARDREPAR